MKIIGVAACTVGIAHTYIAQEKYKSEKMHSGAPACLHFDRFDRDFCIGGRGTL